MSDLAVVVLAAGVGKRFRSAIPKVLHRAAGPPLIHHVLKAVRGIDGAGRVLVVVGHGKERIADAVAAVLPDALLVDQPEPLGTADAVKRCRQALAEFEGTVLVLPGDTPLVRPESLDRLVAEHRKSESAVSLLTAVLDDPTGYGRVVRDERGNVRTMVEESDAGPAERAIAEVSTGIWCFEKAALFDALEEVTADNVQGEYYLPDAALVISSKEGNMYTVMAGDPTEVRGVNDRAQLAEAAKQLRLRYLEKLAASGVSIQDPETTYVDEGVEVGADTVLRPLTFLEGSTRIGSRCEIGPASRIVDSVVEDGAEVTFAVVRESIIGPGAKVGPFASVRPGTRLGPGGKIGTFVEVKASSIGEGSKVPHLSYVGDAEIGKDVNLGAGTITGNYDTETKAKSKTVVEDGAFTGSDTTLIAPVRLGKDAGTGAGSVVTKDVPPGEVVAGVPAKPLRKRKPRDNRGEDDT